ncbi:hypothetical protein GH714_001820 [Hevea brasiliensis]|uniref:F-box domain-containing protein n=1 Tax=Hevea brasiliensis TaxID=3981 RepID=A0A6A6LX54_HEVBR|nr:hypothetical protein GH714_001820 [Hevea brasiliensis]
MDPYSKRKKELPERPPESTRPSPFPDEVLELVLGLLKSNKDRSSVSLVCKDWYNAESWSRTHVFIGNCYSVSPEIVARRFPKIRSVTLKGKPRFSDFNLVPRNWGADIQSWLVVFASKYPFLEELRLKRMTVTDESLEFLALNFPNFKALSLLSCDGFSTDGLAAIATHCKNLTELDIQENGIDDKSGNWLGCLPENFSSLEVLNFANLNSDVNFDALERLVLDTVEDKGLEAVGSNCPLLEELRVFPADPFDEEIVHGVTEAGFVAVSYGCRRLHYVLYFCRQMTNAAVATIVQNCPNFTHFRLCIMNPGQPDYMTNEPMDEAFGAVVKTCSKLQRLSVQEMPRLNVEVMKEEGSDDSQADKVYVYRSVAGPRRDAPPSVLTLSVFTEGTSPKCRRWGCNPYFCDMDG